MAWNPAVASAEIRRALTISSSDESHLAVTDISTDGSDLIVEQAVDVSELFSPPRMTVRRSRFGLRPGASFDLLEGCDLSSAAGRAQVWAHVEKFAPRVLVASPPCTRFSQLMRTNKPKMERSVWEARRLEAESFLNFCCQLFRYQLEHERFFAFEHPHGADSWSLPMLQQFRQLQGVYFSVFDECRFNLERLSPTSLSGSELVGCRIFQLSTMLSTRSYANAKLNTSPARAALRAFDCLHFVRCILTRCAAPF